LQYEPEIIEFHLNMPDLDNLELIKSRIRWLKSKGIKVYLHQPPKVNDIFLDLMTGDIGFYKLYVRSSEILAQLCDEEDVFCVIHAHYNYMEENHAITRANTMKLRRRIEEIVSFAGDRFLWEDTIKGLFSHTNPYLMEEVVAPLNLPLNVDVSHSFIAWRGDNEKLKQVLVETKPYTRYYHLVDSMGEFHDSLPLGKGRIDWSMVKPYVEDSDFIFEINLEGDHSDCTLMIESAAHFNRIDKFEVKFVHE
jgi:hypothetical protein